MLVERDVWLLRGWGEVLSSFGAAIGLWLMAPWWGEDMLPVGSWLDASDSEVDGVSSRGRRSCEMG